MSIAQICYVLDGGLKPTISPPYPLPLKQHGLRRAPLGQSKQAFPIKPSIIDPGR